MILLINVVVVFGLVVGIYMAGQAAGRRDNPPTVSEPSPAPTAACDAACKAWDFARQMQCSANADEAAARSRADGIRNEALGVLAGAFLLAGAGAGLVAAAGAATATVFGIPAGVLLMAAAIAMFAAAAAAFSLADFLFGQLAAAERDVADKAAIRQAWDAETVRTRNEVNANCTIDQANACLSRSAPC